MPMSDAERLLHDMRINHELRIGAYECENGISMQAYFIARGYVFTDHEWDNALSSLRLKARDEEAAAEIIEIREWYKYMRGIE
jgi:hypothetical protein